MKTSDYIAKFLHEQGVTVVYEMIGGMITRLVDSLHQNGKFVIVSMHHEQAAGFAAEGWARMQGVPGVAMATSGPGATNLVTAIGSCYFDYTPVVFITGQVNTHEMVKNKAIRQQGFQETDIVSIVRPITKATWQALDAQDLPHIMAEAFRTAMTAPRGPVLIDIPMDVQARDISDFPSPAALNICTAGNHEVRSAWIEQFLADLRLSSRPIIMAGGGIRSAGAAGAFQSFIDATHIPVVESLMGLDALPYTHPCRVGFIGTYGNRWANKALMQSDLVLVLGARLDVRQTGAQE
ncbi:MAG: thiamine pyrophosphate-binding protein [bacterium]